MRLRRTGLRILMMMTGPSCVMTVNRIHVQLIGHPVGLLAKSVARLHRRRRLHRCQVRVRLPALIAGTVSSVSLAVTVRRGESLVVVRAATGTW